MNEYINKNYSTLKQEALSTHTHIHRELEGEGIRIWNIAIWVIYL